MPTSDSYTSAIRMLRLGMRLLADPERKWRAQEIAQLTGVSEDTALRDLKHLSMSGLVPIKQNGVTAGSTWQVDPVAEPMLRPLRLSYAEGAALVTSARLLAQQQGERIDDVRAALLALIRVLPEPLQAPLEAIVADMHAGTTSVPQVSRAFTALAEGWVQRRVVRLTYDPPHKRQYECRFAPYLLEPSGIGHTLYFIGQSDPPGALRTYKLERVRHAELTDEPFEVPADFNGPALLRRAWGVMYGEGEPVHVKLRFSHFASKRVRETRWHASQRLTPTSEGLIWEADIGDMTEIRPWIRGWGADCEVLEPPELRQELMTEARRLIRLYGLAEPHGRADGPDQGLLDSLFGKE